MQGYQQVGEPPVDGAPPELPVVLGQGSMPIYPTHDGIFAEAYGCTNDSDNAAAIERTRIETALALKHEELEKEDKRRRRHEVLEEASMDFLEGTPPALLNAYLYAQEHELGPAVFNAAMAIPLLGTIGGGVRQGFHRASSALKQIPYHKPIGEGSTSIVRPYGPLEVLKEIIPIYRETDVLARLKPGDQERLAELLVAGTTALRGVIGEQIPETRLAGPGFIRQSKVEGLVSGSLDWKPWLRALINRFWFRRRVRKATNALRKDNKLFPGVPWRNGWVFTEDLHTRNFVHHENGDIKALVDPYWIGDPAWWDFIHPWHGIFEKHRNPHLDRPVKATGDKPHGSRK